MTSLLITPNRGRHKSTAGHTPPVTTTNQKRGGERFSSPEGLHDSATSSLHRCGKRIGAADAIGVKDPHRGLQRPQPEAEDEAVTDVEVVAKGKSPPTLREDGVAAHTEDDVHMLDQLWPALLDQHDLTNGEAGSREHPLDRLRQPKGGEAPILDDDKEP
jgi:hypothetical protein